MSGVAGYQQAIADLRWLADARDEYDNPEVRANTSLARHLADILAGTNDGAGWLPSWHWKPWKKRRKVAVAPDEGILGEMAAKGLRNRVAYALQETLRSEKPDITLPDDVLLALAEAAITDLRTAHLLRTFEWPPIPYPDDLAHQARWTMERAFKDARWRTGDDAEGFLAAADALIAEGWTPPPATAAGA